MVEIVVSHVSKFGRHGAPGVCVRTAHRMSEGPRLKPRPILGLIQGPEGTLLPPMKRALFPSESSSHAGAKARSSFASFSARLNSLLKKSLDPNRNPEKLVSGAKARVDFSRVMPGMNPRPTARTTFSASCEAVPWHKASGLNFQEDVSASQCRAEWLSCAVI